VDLIFWNKRGVVLAGSIASFSFTNNFAGIYIVALRVGEIIQKTNRFAHHRVLFAVSQYEIDCHK